MGAARGSWRAERSADSSPERLIEIAAKVPLTARLFRGRPLGEVSKEQIQEWVAEAEAGYEWPS